MNERAKKYTEDQKERAMANRIQAIQYALDHQRGSVKSTIATIEHQAARFLVFIETGEFPK
jgi:hypothetical protein|tara:strand:- start:761 stop:943 length:183 start_codon:yes stop_codon:yes gene_type:complete